MIASAFSLSQRMPEPFSRAVNVLQVASVGPLLIYQPWARNAEGEIDVRSFLVRSEI